MEAAIRHKLPVIRQMNPGDVIYSKMTKVNTAVWFIGKLLLKNLPSSF